MIMIDFKYTNILRIFNDPDFNLNYNFEFNLPTIPIINTNLKESEIQEWKEKLMVKLFIQKINNLKPET